MDFSKPIDMQDDQTGGDVTKEAISFDTYCYACTKEGKCKMCIATIPFFKEIIIMAFSCDYCGHRNAEIKQGGGISAKATKITFEVIKPIDLNRDVFKSDTTFFSIPELGLELQPGTLGSVYTTVEGLLDKIIEHLDDVNPFGKGDSATNVKFIEFLDSLRAMKNGERPFTFVLDDPLSNCFIYNPRAPEDDPQIIIDIYERTWEQNEELGINDMSV
jgi:zinc finger protein